MSGYGFNYHVVVKPQLKNIVEVVDSSFVYVFNSLQANQPSANWHLEACALRLAKHRPHIQNWGSCIVPLAIRLSAGGLMGHLASTGTFGGWSKRRVANHTLQYLICMQCCVGSTMIGY